MDDAKLRMFNELAELSTRDKLALIEIEDAGSRIECEDLYERRSIEPREMFAERLDRLARDGWIDVKRGVVYMKPWATHLISELVEAAEARRRERVEDAETGI